MRALYIVSTAVREKGHLGKEAFAVLEITNGFVLNVILDQIPSPFPLGKQATAI